MGSPRCYCARLLPNVSILGQGRVVVRGLLMDAIYSCDDEVSPNAFDVLVYRLRRHVAALEAGVEILTMRGLGVMIRTTERPCATEA